MFNHNWRLPSAKVYCCAGILVIMTISDHNNSSESVDLDLQWSSFAFLGSIKLPCQDRNVITQHEARHKTDSELRAGIEIDARRAQPYAMLFKFRGPIITTSNSRKVTRNIIKIHAYAVINNLEVFISIVANTMS